MTGGPRELSIVARRGLQSKVATVKDDGVPSFVADPEARSITSEDAY